MKHKIRSLIGLSIAISLAGCSNNDQRLPPPPPKPPDYVIHRNGRIYEMDSIEAKAFFDSLQIDLEHLPVVD